jgi:primosomal protein N' (replication factor Y)
LAIQTYHVLAQACGENHVILWHSDISEKERLEHWWRIKRGEVSIVVGARSAVLTPVPNLGVVIVDEEQDSTYKEERKPRFHAREVAIHLAETNGALAMMGSATPSVDMMHRVNTGEITLVELQERAVKASRPHIDIVDLKKEKFKGALSLPLHKALEDRLKLHQKSILFLNRRGFFRYLRCPVCSWVARCPNCDIALGHRKTKPLSCHYCAYQSNAPKNCPVCKHDKLFAGGYGTERLEAEVQEKFPWAHILRWDKDSAAKRGQHEKIFQQFSAGEVDILVGTQMVAQGFNFPGVTLVGVIDADVPLYAADFRAAEHAFQWITQVAGRAGREMVTGDVIIQTRHPDHYALHFAAQMDYKGFAAAELQFREDLNYPPYTHLVRIVTQSKNSGRSEKDMDQLVEWASNLEGEFPIGVLGPSKVKKDLQVLLKVPLPMFRRFLEALKEFLAARSNRFWVDVDPESFH